jgi:hypothetical protein
MSTYRKITHFWELAKQPLKLIGERKMADDDCYMVMKPEANLWAGKHISIG